MVGGLFIVLVAIIIAAAVVWLIKKRRKITEKSAHIDQKVQVEENKNFKSLSSLHHQIDDDHDHDWERDIGQAHCKSLQKTMLPTVFKPFQQRTI